MCMRARACAWHLCALGACACMAGVRARRGAARPWCDSLVCGPFWIASLISTEWHNSIRELPLGKLLLVPGGWNGLLSRGGVVHAVERTGGDLYSFYTINTGPGLAYHPSTAADSDGTPPKVKYQTVLAMPDVPACKVCDPSFWALLFSLWLKQPPSELQRAEVVYDVLLPWLAESAPPATAAAATTTAQAGAGGAGVAGAGPAPGAAGMRLMSQAVIDGVGHAEAGRGRTAGARRSGRATARARCSRRAASCCPAPARRPRS